MLINTGREGKKENKTIITFGMAHQFVNGRNRNEAWKYWELEEKINERESRIQSGKEKL